MASGPVLIVIALGLLTSVVMVVLALRAGRRRPEHRWLWWLALAAIAASVLFHGAIAIVMLLNAGAADGVAVLMGTSALAGALLLAVWRPAWAGWMLIGTGLAQPAVLWILQSLAGTAADEGVPAEGMLAVYGMPAVVTGAVLLLSTWRRHTSTTVGHLSASVQ